MPPEFHFRAHDDGEERDVNGDDREHRVGVGLAVDNGRAAGGVSEHITLLHLILMKGMLHHYICSARESL
jgi:hypothetical protein